MMKQVLGVLHLKKKGKEREDWYKSVSGMLGTFTDSEVNITMRGIILVQPAFINCPFCKFRMRIGAEISSIVL